MGVAVGTPEENAPLLEEPMHQNPPGQLDLPVTQYPHPAGSWDGNLLQCCGRSCTRQGWLSCAFAYFVPFLAFGHNLRRALGASLWLHALVFFVLFYAVHRSFLVAVNITADSCRADGPAHTKLLQPRPLDETAHASWLSGRKLLQVDDARGNFAQAFADVLPSATAYAVVHGRSADHPKQAMPISNTHQTDDLPAESAPDEASQPLEQRAEVKCVYAPGAAEPDCTTVFHPTQPKPPPPHPAVIPFTSEFGKATPGCQRAYAGLFALFHLSVVALLLGILYAAHHRTLIRKKYLIPGSACGDICAWLCCSTCALCQETRTVRANQASGLGPFSAVTANQMAVEGQAATKPPKIVEV